MIFLISFLTSLCIQFAAVDYPLDYTAVNDMNYSTVQTIWNNLLSAGYNIDPQYLILINRSDSLTPSGSSPYAVFYPAEPFNQSQSSYTISARTDTYITVNTTNYYRWLVKSDLSLNSTTPTVSNLGKCGFYDITTNTYTNSSSNFMYNAYYTFPYNDINTFSWVDDVPAGIEGFGSLGHSGFIPGSNPVDSLSDFPGWSITAHSTNSVNITDPVTAVDSSSPSNNLLAQIVNNTKSIYNYLGNINSNIINGISALFNAVSGGFNAIHDEISSEFIIDFEAVSSAWHNTSIYTLVSIADSTPTTISNTTDDIIISWNFSNLVFGVPNNNIDVSAIRSISGSYNLSQALNPSKSVWQPLLLTFLYGFTFWNFIRSIPNIINGVSSVTNSKEVKEKLK